MEWSFRVCLSSISAKQLSCQKRSPTARPFLRFDFDGKIIQTELSYAAGDPTWELRRSFEYRLLEPSLQAVTESLSQRRVMIEGWFGGSSEIDSQESYVGAASMDLLSLATGPASCSFELRRGDVAEVVGVVMFTLEMEQQSLSTIQLRNVAVLGLPRPTSAQLRCYLVSDPQSIITSSVSKHSSDPSWETGCKLQARVTLRSLIDDTMRVEVCDFSAVNNAPLGRFDIPMSEFLTSNVGHSAMFKRNVYAESTAPVSFTALATGTVQFYYLPALAQFRSGSFSNGVAAGRPVLECCAVPQSYRARKSGIPSHHMPVPSSQMHYVSPTGPTTSRFDLDYARPAPQTALARTPTPADSIRPVSPMKSPMVSVTEHLLEQHSEAVRGLDMEKQRVATMAEEIRNKSEVEDRNAASRFASLEAEEKREGSQLHIIERHLMESRHALESLDVEHTEFLKQTQTKKAQLELELMQLQDAEQQLVTLLRSIQVHAAEDEKQRERARSELEATKTRYVNDSKSVLEVEAALKERHAGRATTMDLPKPQSYESHAAPTNPVQPSDVHHFDSQEVFTGSVRRRQNPPIPESWSEASRIPSAGTSAVPGGSYFAPQLSLSKPAAMTTSVSAIDSVVDLLDACKANDPVRFGQVMQASPDAVHLDHSFLHYACAARHPSTEIVSQLAKLRPELVNAVDNKTGNTPLHFACGAEDPNMEVIDILLASGAMINCFNRDGLSPYHIALLNVDDSASRLRRYLLFKAGVSVNQPTAKGETPAHILVNTNANISALQFLAQHGGAVNTLALVHNADSNAVPMTPLQKAQMYLPANEAVCRFLQQCAHRETSEQDLFKSR